MASSDKPTSEAKPKSQGKKHIGRNIALFVLFVVIVVTFVFSGGKFGKGTDTSRIDFGSWKGTPIYFEPGNYFSEQLQLAMQSYEQQMPASPGETDEQAKSRRNYIIYLGLQYAFSQSTLQTAVLRDLADAGYAPQLTTSYVDMLLSKSYELFGDRPVTKLEFNSMNVSDRDKLASKYSQQYTVLKYFDEIYAQGKLSGSVSYGYRTSSQEVAFIKSMAAKERGFDYVFIPFSAYPDGEVKAYADKNKALFRYMKLSRIYFDKTKEETEKLLAEMKAKGTSFEDMAKAYSVDDATKATGGIVVEPSYAWSVEKTLTDPKDLDKVFALKKGELSPLLRGSLGFYIYRCDEEVKDADLSKADTLAAVRKYIEDNAKSEIEAYAAQKAQDLRKAALASGLEKAAAAAGLKVKSIEPFSPNFGKISFLMGNPNGGQPISFSFFKMLDFNKAPEFTNLETDEKFIGAAKSLKAGEISEVLSLYPYKDDSGSKVDLPAGVALLVLKEEKDADPVNVANFENSWPAFIVQKTYAEYRALIMKSKDLVDGFQSGASEMLRDK